MDFGMYTDQGLLSCDTDTSRGAIGSLGHEAADVAFFASLNATTVKVDNCFVDGKDNSPKVPRTDFVTRFKAMGDALKANGIKGMTICQWGVPYSSPDSGLQGPAQWTGDISTSYRLSDDIAKGWTSILQISNQAMHIAKRGMSGPGHFADADLLEVGNGGLTAAEEKTHFSLWAMLKSNVSWRRDDVSRAVADRRSPFDGHAVDDFYADGQGFARLTRSLGQQGAARHQSRLDGQAHPTHPALHQ